MTQKLQLDNVLLAMLGVKKYSEVCFFFKKNTVADRKSVV